MAILLNNRAKLNRQLFTTDRPCLLRLDELVVIQCQDGGNRQISDAGAPSEARR